MFIAERRASSEPLRFQASMPTDQLAEVIEGVAKAGEPRLSVSLESLDQLDYPSLQVLLSAREYCIQRGLVMRLVNVSEEVQERIRWADAGRLLEDDLMLV
jgi:anti-anti-sigma regulatory factor